MILIIDNQESATLTLHMAIMRKSFKKLIKSRYKEQKGDFLASFDYVHAETKKALELFEEQGIEEYHLNLNITDLLVLKEFLKAYTGAIQCMEVELQEEDEKQVKILEKLFVKSMTMVSEVMVNA